MAPDRCGNVIIFSKECSVQLRITPLSSAHCMCMHYPSTDTSIPKTQHSPEHTLRLGGPDWQSKQTHRACACTTQTLTLAHRKTQHSPEHALRLGGPDWQSKQTHCTCACTTQALKLAYHKTQLSCTYTQAGKTSSTRCQRTWSRWSSVCVPPLSS